MDDSSVLKAPTNGEWLSSERLKDPEDQREDPENLFYMGENSAIHLSRVPSFHRNVGGDFILTLRRRKSILPRYINWVREL